MVQLVLMRIVIDHHSDVSTKCGFMWLPVAIAHGHEVDQDMATSIAEALSEFFKSTA